MKNFLMIFFLVAAFAFTSSAQDYVGQKEAVERLEVEIDQTAGNSATASLSQISLRDVFYGEVVRGIEEKENDDREYDDIIDAVYNRLSANGQNKVADEASAIRTEIRQLLSV